MKLPLINPYFEGRVYTPSIGLLVLATTVRREMGIPVRVLEPSPQRYSFKQVVDIAKDYTHTGISCYTESRFSSVDLAQAIKGSDHNKVLIVGGHQVISLSRVTVIPCCAGNEGNRREFQRKYTMGNIFQTPFKQIWKSQKYSQFRSRAHNNVVPRSVPVMSRIPCFYV